MLQAWRLIDFGPDLTRIRRTALVIAESGEAAASLCTDSIAVPFPAEIPYGENPFVATESLVWEYIE